MCFTFSNSQKKKKVKIFRLSHKTRFKVSCVIFYGFSCDFMPVSYSRCCDRLVRFIHPGIDTWCRPATTTEKTKRKPPVMLHRRSREGHGRFVPPNRLFEVGSDDLLPLSSYRFSTFKACYCGVSSWFSTEAQRFWKISDSQRLMRNLWSSSGVTHSGLLVGKNASLLVFSCWLEIYGFLHLCFCALLLLHHCMNTN